MNSCKEIHLSQKVIGTPVVRINLSADRLPQTGSNPVSYVEVLLLLVPSVVGVYQLLMDGQEGSRYWPDAPLPGTIEENMVKIGHLHTDTYK